MTKDEFTKLVYEFSEAHALDDKARIAKWLRSSDRGRSEPDIAS